MGGLVAALTRADHVSFRSSALDPVEGTAASSCVRSRSPPTASPARSVTPPAGARARSTRSRENRSCAGRSRACASRSTSTSAARNENVELQQAAELRPGPPTFPRDFDRSAPACSRPPGTATRASRSPPAAATRHHDVLKDVVITTDGLVGTVSTVFGGESRVTLITDPSSAVGRTDQTIRPPSACSSTARARRRARPRPRDEGQAASAPATRSSPPARPRGRSSRRSSRAASRSARRRASDQTTPTSSRDPGAAVRRLLVAPVGDRAGAEVAAVHVILDALKAALVLFVACWSRSSVLDRVRALRRHRRASSWSRCSRSRSCAARSSARSPASAPGCCSTRRRSARSASRRSC